MDTFDVCIIIWVLSADLPESVLKEMQDASANVYSPFNFNEEIIAEIHTKAKQTDVDRSREMAWETCGLCLGFHSSSSTQSQTGLLAQSVTDLDEPMMWQKGWDERKLGSWSCMQDI